MATAAEIEALFDDEVKSLHPSIYSPLEKVAIWFAVAVFAIISFGLIFANDVSKKEIGFNSDFNKVSMIDQKGNIKILPKNKKSFIANKIAQILLDKLIDDRNIN